MFSIFYYTITQREEISKLLVYSDKVDTAKIRREKKDLVEVTREELFKKFDLTNE